MGTTAAQLQIGAALHNGEQRLIGPSVRRTAALGPANRAFDGDAQIIRRCAVRRTLIQAHGDVRAEVFLDGNSAFGCQLHQRTIDVRTKHGGMIVDLARRRQAVDLKTAAVGENGTVPAHEVMQAAQFSNHIVAGPQREVIGVAQNYLGSGVSNLIRCQSLDRGLRADRHKDRRLDNAMRRLQPSATCQTTDSQNLKTNAHNKPNNFTTENTENTEKRQRIKRGLESNWKITFSGLPSSFVFFPCFPCFPW